MSSHTQPAFVETGRSFPLGSTAKPGGVNFSVYSRAAHQIELLLFDRVDDPDPSATVPMTPTSGQRTTDYWQCFVPGLEPGQIYGYRVKSEGDRKAGLVFDPEKVLLDPYGKAIAIPDGYDREAGIRPGANEATAMKSVVVPPNHYDWEGDEPLYRSHTETVIYEMHVAGFTRHPNSGVAPELRGTYRGLVEKIPYLKSLGITAVELSPVFQFDPQESPPGLENYWGYNPVSFFVPHAGYGVKSDPIGVLDEFRDMVKALHREGIEVILDVVYNHTAEGNEQGPTFCFKGIDNPTYYIQDPIHGGYANFSGTGNTLNAGHSVVRRLILDSLRYWVTEMHVDGFRFDLASILARDTDGHPLPNPPVLWDIETDPVLSGVKLIAEAWDAAGLYQVGSFFGDHWREWNGRFRDDVRAFVRGDAGHAERVAHRFLASPDIYGHRQRTFDHTINFVTCHDGFTLNDLVSYNEKHNLGNGENNLDGHDHNLSWNCGVEGPTDDPEIEKLRIRQIKNFHAINLLSLGVPMLLMGDEVRRTQQGNNNAYCQDNEISWFDWSLPEKHDEILRFTRELIKLRRIYRATGRPRMPLDELLSEAEIKLHGTRADRPDTSHQSRSIAFSASGLKFDYFVAFNAFWEPLSFQFPNRKLERGSWRRVVDTSLAPPDDVTLPDAAPIIEENDYRVGARSVAGFVRFS